MAVKKPFIFYIVPQSHIVVVERLGKFARVQERGFRFRIPFIEKVHEVDDWREPGEKRRAPDDNIGRAANKYGWMIELAEQQTDTEKRECQTKDNVVVEANASVYWRIVDAASAVYEVDVLPRSVADITLNALRSNIGTLMLDEVLSGRESLNKEIAAQLKDTCKKWGIVVSRVEIQELRITDEETANAMRQEMAAERKRRALILEAEGKSESMIRIADAEAQSMDKIADAEAHYLQKLSEEVDPQTAGLILLSQKMLETYRTISENKANKVFMPNSVNGLFGGLFNFSDVNENAQSENAKNDPPRS